MMIRKLINTSPIPVLIAILCLVSYSCSKTNADTLEAETIEITTSDIPLFWETYDQIIQTPDRGAQERVFQSNYLDEGSDGVKGLVAARRYTAAEYVDAINSYPIFWESVRANTEDVNRFAHELRDGVSKFEALYPDMKDARIFFSIGALRTNGTIYGGDVLIGAELALADSNTPTGEFPETLGHLPAYFSTNPKANIVALNIHEFIHTQQSGSGGYDLLSQALYEGVAEFLPTLALGLPSASEAVSYGQNNADAVRDAFEKDMFQPWFYNWIWNSPDNPFGVRDLGYYTGYAMAERYYNQSNDKAAAVKALIELDYQDQVSVWELVDASGYFSKPLLQLEAEFEARRPRVIDYVTTKANPSETDIELTVTFSQQMDERFRSTDFGPLGKEHYPEIKSITFDEYGLNATYVLGVQPGVSYQMKIDLGFRTFESMPLIPKLIEFSVPDAD